MRPRRLLANFAPAIVAISLAPLVGCGSGRPAVTPVEGKVTYKGQPVTTGTITFTPEKGSLAAGKILPNGTYKLSTFAENDGALPGKYGVAIVANEPGTGGMPGSSPDYKPPKEIVPAIYNDAKTSRLKAEVTNEKKPIDFDLK